MNTVTTIIDGNGIESEIGDEYARARIAALAVSQGVLVSSKESLGGDDLLLLAAGTGRTASVQSTTVGALKELVNGEVRTAAIPVEKIAALFEGGG